MSKSIYKNAVWSEQKVNQIRSYLQDHAPGVGDRGNFKNSAYKAAARHIALYHKSGPIKTSKYVKNKYKTVKTMSIEHIYWFTDYPLI